jgi:hypothetical protein
LNVYRGQIQGAREHREATIGAERRGTRAAHRLATFGRHVRAPSLADAPVYYEEIRTSARVASDDIVCERQKRDGPAIPRERQGIWCVDYSGAAKSPDTDQLLGTRLDVLHEDSPVSVYKSYEVTILRKDWEGIAEVRCRVIVAVVYESS